MLGYNISLTLESLRTILRVAIDIIIIWFLVYYCLKVVRTNSRTSQIFKGIIVVVLVNALSKFFGLTTVAWLSDMFISWGFLAIIIVFQPELRKLLEQFGQRRIAGRNNVDQIAVLSLFDRRRCLFFINAVHIHHLLTNL